MKKLMLSVFALVAFGFSANAIDATAGAQLIAPNTFAVNDEGANAGKLEFGKIATGTDGTLVLSANGATSVDPTATTASTGVVLLNGTARTLAAFTVTGSDPREFTVAFGAANVTGGSGVSIASFTTNLVDNKGAVSSGSKDFYVGATLTLASATAASYVGTYSVTVSYE